MLSPVLKQLLASDLDVRIMRWVLVLIFALFGYSKWFPYEAQALLPLIGNSPLLSWMYQVFGIQGASHALGVAEWTIALGLTLGAWLPRVSVVAAAASCLTYLTTLTLILTSPNAWQASAGGFPAMGGSTSFLIKDAVLLAGSIMLLKSSLLQVANTCPKHKATAP